MEMIKKNSHKQFGKFKVLLVYLIIQKKKIRRTIGLETQRRWQF